ncbi:MAG: DUF2271 domain-containing protein [Clostridiales Family XIII bacterium]|jgi:CubicO group peptidase (beta-lactamase class C family)|nr:DUF2271 domain-containing protein [Clostridiales Family XIII bacterium]
MKIPLFSLFLCSLMLFTSVTWGHGALTAASATPATTGGATSAESVPVSDISSDGRIIISFDYVKQSGHASNQFAVWIEDENGNHIKTLYATNFTAQGGYANRPDSIPTWVEKSGLASMSKEQADAISGATPQTGRLYYTWDLTDENGAAVDADMQYKFFAEGSLRWKNRVLYSGVIDLGNMPAGLDPVVEYHYEASEEQPALNSRSKEHDMISGLVAEFYFDSAGDASLFSSAREEIDKIVREELIRAKIPVAAIAVLREGQTEYLYYGASNFVSVDSDNTVRPNDEASDPDKAAVSTDRGAADASSTANPDDSADTNGAASSAANSTLAGGRPSLNINSLFQIGALSNSYTAVGVLLLESYGWLSLDDPVNKHLPRFEAFYKNKPVPPEDITIADLLYQTSGISDEKAAYFRITDDTPQDINARGGRVELESYPSQEYAYSDTNYYLLRLIIAAVSNRSYESFLTEDVLAPLGLNNTYTDPQSALNTGRIIDGSRLSFLNARPYPLPTADRNTSAAYIISDVQDMVRWLQIQMGEAKIPERFVDIIEKSHQVNSLNTADSSAADPGASYAAGWFVDESSGEIYHSGYTVGYSAKAAIRTRSGIAVCVLTNMNSAVNTDNIAYNILNILEDKAPSDYEPDIKRIFDIIFTSLTVICAAAIALMLILAFRRIRLLMQIGKSRRGDDGWTFRKTIWLAFPLDILLLIAAAIIISPILLGVSFSALSLWLPASVFSGLAATGCLAICLSVYKISL